MVCAQVIGYDATIAWCGAAGNFELNVMMPVMAYDLLAIDSICWRRSRGISRRAVSRAWKRMRNARPSLVEQSLAMVTVLAPEIGYEKAAAIAKEAYATAGAPYGKSRRKRADFPERRLNELLDPESQAGGQ